MFRIAVLFSCLAAQSAAGQISLAQPIDCVLGDTCYIQQFVDNDPSPATRDFACGNLTYDGHKGTDFGLPSLAAQAAGVQVLAAASGIVVGVRDEMADILQGTPGAPDVSDRECGNGVVIDHGDGWETQYCHMAQGSVTVKSGDTVNTGTTLGRVGLSGQTEFPHVHLSVRKDGAMVDPFDADGVQACSGAAEDTLFTPTLPTPPAGFISAGFAEAVPDYADVKSGTAAAARLSATGPALVVWGYVYGGRIGDVLTLTIDGPAGHIHDASETLERDQAQLFRASGRRTPAGGWEPGDYTGVVTIVRNDVQLDEMTVAITLTP